MSAIVVLSCAEGSLAKAAIEVVASVSGCCLETVSSLSAVSPRVARGDVDLVLACLNDNDGEAKLRAFLRDNAKAGSQIPVVVLAKNLEAALALRVLQLGVVDCLSWPLDLARLRFLVDVLTVRVRQGGAETSPTGTSDRQLRSSDISGFMFFGHAMQGVLKQCHAVARSEVTVLLTGETGVGKSHLARVIHELSPRRSKPFLAVGCGSLTSSLLASELFGHVRGAFTGADTDHIGKLAAAADGTILLDDIDCVPLEAQAKLLRALDDRVFEPVGSVQTQPLRARLIVSSNRPLEEEVEAGRLREDLYYRISVANVTLPPLRDQPELIQPLAETFLADFCRQYGRRIKVISAAALAALEACHWPGNVRQLHNAIEHAVVMAEDDVLDVADLPKTIWSGEQTTPGKQEPQANELRQIRSKAELNRIVEALQNHGNNRSLAAMELGISRVTLYKKMHLHGLI